MERVPSLLSSAAVLLLLSGCPEDPEPPAPAARYDAAQLGESVDLICPGDPLGRCDFGGSPDLIVGAAAVDITPVQYETWIDEDGDSEYKTSVDTFLDCGADRLCPGDPGYPGEDLWEGNGRFDAMWLAGFGNGRPMQDVADPIWARVTWIEQGNTSLGIVALDVVGFFFNEVEEIRAAAREALDLDHVIVVSTHVHEAPDTMGIWGPQIAYSGVNPEFMSHIHSQVADALAEARTAAVPADLRLGHFVVPDTAWDGSGINNINIDTRDPNITDPNFWTARFVARGTDDTISTWVNWPNHPEASGSRNIRLTSDYVHTLRETVEDGAPEGPEGALDGVGGVTVFLSGPVGGMQTPLGCDTIDLDGTVYSSNNIDKAYAVGRVAGYHALQAIATEEQAVDPLLHLRTRQLDVDVENRGYHLMFQLGIFDREAYNYNPNQLINDNNVPQIRSEVSIVTLGPLAIATVPGELFPELAIGGYDGEWTGPLQSLVSENNDHPPDLTAAPAGPYLVDHLLGQSDEITHTMVWSLANDELGYLIPNYDFILHDTSPYLNDAPGDHYEETNSVGISAHDNIVGNLTDLAQWPIPALPTPE